METGVIGANGRSAVQHVVQGKNEEDENVTTQNHDLEEKSVTARRNKLKPVK